MAKKPSGTTGPVTVTVNSEGASIQHRAIRWPTDQKQIERKILDYFIRELEKTGAKILDIKDGGTEELDFLLTLPGGQSHLELMEAVVPEARVPFQPGHMRHEPIPYADTIFKGVQKKIDKYGMRHEVPIDLLIYVTHEQYNPNEAAIWALRTRFAEVRHPFAYVFFLVPLDESHASLWVLFNKDHPFVLPSIHEISRRTWTNLAGAEAFLGEGGEAPGD